MNYLHAIVAAALVAAGAYGVAQLRAHWIGTGEARVQAKWDAQQEANRKAAAEQVKQQAREAEARKDQVKRNADEQIRLDAARRARLAAALAELERLRQQLAAGPDGGDAALPTAGDPAAESCAREAAALRFVVGRCQERRTDVAAAAEALRDQVIGLQADAAMCRSVALPEVVAP